MRRILITSEIEALAEEYRDNLFMNKNKRFKHPQDRLKQLIDTMHNNKYNNKYINYVQAIIDNFDEIIVLHPKDFEAYKIDHFSLLTDTDLSSKNWKNGAKVSFADAIIKAMRYEDVRKSEIPYYVEKLGIKTCVYCNAHYTATIHVSKTEIKGGYQIDHFKPKSKFPFLCISFFNLQPCCANCNLLKSDTSIEFNLYTEDSTKLNPFEFSLTKESVIKYMLYQDAEKLEILLAPTKSFNLDVKKYEKVFHTKELYKNFNDEAEELIWKYKTRNNTYIEQLIKSFMKFFPLKQAYVKRFLYGFYDNEKDIHRRPLTKMKHDIAKQLGLI